MGQEDQNFKVLQSKFEASLCFMRLCLIKPKQLNHKNNIRARGVRSSGMSRYSGKDSTGEGRRGHILGGEGRTAEAWCVSKPERPGGRSRVCAVVCFLLLP